MARSTTRIGKLIHRITLRSANQRADVQEALIECAMFAFEDRNVDPAIRLFKAVGGETHRAGMSKWLSLHGAIHFKDGIPMLSDKRQKELANTTTAEKYEADLKVQAPWFAMDENNNKAVNIWDGNDQLQKARDYLSNLCKKAKKNNDAPHEQLFREAETILARALNAMYEAPANPPVQQGGEQPSTEGTTEQQ